MCECTLYISERRVYGEISRCSRRPRLDLLWHPPFIARLAGTPAVFEIMQRARQQRSARLHKPMDG
jgi:hypothetical protein